MKHIDICKHEIKSSNWQSILFKRSVIDTTIHRSADPSVGLSLALFTSWAYVNANVAGKWCFPSPLRKTNSAVSDGWGRGWAWKRAGHLKNRWDDTGKALSSISSTQQTLNKRDHLLLAVIVRHMGPSAGFRFYEVCLRLWCKDYYLRGQGRQDWAREDSAPQNLLSRSGGVCLCFH